jgi:hypothetical protein
VRVDGARRCRPRGCGTGGARRPCPSTHTPTPAPLPGRRLEKVEPDASWGGIHRPRNFTSVVNFLQVGPRRGRLWEPPPPGSREARAARGLHAPPAQAQGTRSRRPLLLPRPQLVHPDLSTANALQLLWMQMTPERVAAAADADAGADAGADAPGGEPDAGADADADEPSSDGGSSGGDGGSGAGGAARDTGGAGTGAAGDGGDGGPRDEHAQWCRVQ